MTFCPASSTIAGAGGLFSWLTTYAVPRVSKSARVAGTSRLSRISKPILVRNGRVGRNHFETRRREQINRTRDNFIIGSDKWERREKRQNDRPTRAAPTSAAR